MPESPPDPLTEMERAVMCLALALPGSVYKDVAVKFAAVRSDLLAARAALAEAMERLWFEWEENHGGIQPTDPECCSTCEFLASQEAPK